MLRGLQRVVGASLNGLASQYALKRGEGTVNAAVPPRVR